MKPSVGFPQPWLRPVLIIGELLIVAAIVYVATLSQLMLVMLLPFALGTLLIFLRWPGLGIIATVSLGLVVPYLGPSGLNVTMILLALMLSLWLLDMLFRQGRIQLKASRTVWPLFAFLLSAAVSFGFGELPWFAFAIHAPLGAQLGGMSVIVLSAVAFLLMANQVHDLLWLSRITWAFLAIGALSVLIRSVLPELGLPTRELFQQVGTVFFIWLVAMAFSQAIFNNTLGGGWRLLLAGLALITLYILFVWKFDDKAGWMSAFACIVAIIGARWWRVGLVLASVGALTFFLLWTGIVGTDEYSASTRLDAWIIMGQIIKISPAFGLGFANYYWYTPLFPIRGYAVSFNSHNNYIDIIAQMGLVGLLCLLWLWWEIGRLGWRLRTQAPPGFAQAYVYGTLGGLAGMVVAAMLGDWVLPFFYNIGLSGFRSSVIGWFFMGGLVTIEQIVKGRTLPLEQE